MKLFVGVTDAEWYEFLSHRPDLPEVNFWQPGGSARFRALKQGELFLFKLHAPNNFIVGGGFFATSSLLPVSIAWETFGAMNGVASLELMRKRIEKYRRRKSPSITEDYFIGNIILEQTFFFRRDGWIPAPSSFRPNTVQGKSYDVGEVDGQELLKAVEARLKSGAAVSAQKSVAEGLASRMFADPSLVRHRLGQGAFRVLVTDSYERQCAVTREHTLPVLEAAHIRPVSLGGQHEVSNGLLLRSDVHTLFDRGYVTIDSDCRFRVSPRLNSDWRNGKVYYQINKTKIVLPKDKSCWPDEHHLEWHAETVFLK